jgi:hypothetical protein
MVCVPGANANALSKTLHVTPLSKEYSESSTPDAGFPAGSAAEKPKRAAPLK